MLALFTNHPKFGDIAAFNQALCGLYASGLGRGVADKLQNEPKPEPVHVAAPAVIAPAPEVAAPLRALAKEDYVELGRMFADVIDRGMRMRQNGHGAPPADPVVITGAALGLPGTQHIFDDSNVARILRGEQLIDTISTRSRKAILDKHITRLVKTDNGGTFETIDNIAEVIRLAGRGNAFDLDAEFGVPTNASPPSTGARSSPSPQASMRSAMRESHSYCATRPPASARSCRIGGGCLKPCATIPA